MKALIQRVARCSVTVDSDVVGQIGHGMLVFLGVGKGDTEAEADNLAERTVVLRMFADPEEKMNLSLRDVNGEALVVSQFTLYADTRRGTRPGYSDAAPAADAERLYEHFKACLARHLGRKGVPSGRFGAMMKVELVNDGPVTIMLETRPGGERA